MARKRRVFSNRLEHENLKVFKQHGFIPKKQSSDNQVVGYCIFCGSVSSKSRTGYKNSFYVNVDSKKWDCKICGLHGGYQTFLREVNSFCIDNATNRKLRALSDERGIRVNTLRDHKVGYNPITKSYTVPVYDLDNESLMDLRIFNFRSFISSAGTTGGLYYGHVLNSSLGSDYEVVWLVEGHWDRMVMMEIIKRLKISNTTVVALAGATSLKAEWTGLFNNKDVIVVLDNDYDKMLNNRQVIGSGKAGMIKAYNLLFKSCESMAFIHWKKKYKNGFDIRALYKSKLLGAKRTYNTINKLLKDEPPDLEKTENYIKVYDKHRYTGEGCQIEEVYDVFNKHLKLLSNDLIDVTYSAILANRSMGKNPVWLYLVGVSGCGKSEAILSLDDHKYIEALTTLTPSTLISGSNYSDQADPSLIPQLDGKVMAIKDFTTILGMNQTHQNEIISLLRDAYDGRCSKRFGTGKRKFYVSKFGIIAGVTHIIDVHSEGLTALGERFIKFKIDIDESIDGEREVLNRVIDNTLGEVKDVMQKELREVGERFLNYEFKLKPTISEKYKKKIIALVQFCKKMRGSVLRHVRTQEITHKPQIEYGTRLTDNLISMGIGLTQLHRLDTLGEDQYRILKRIAKYTPSQNYEMVVKAIHNEGIDDAYNQREICEMIGLPLLTTKMITEDLGMLGILSKEKMERMDAAGNKAFWRLSDVAMRLLDESELYN